MDRNRDNGEGWTVREWRALTLLVECKVLALTLNPRTPMANLISSLGGGRLPLAVERHDHPPRETRRRLVGYGKLL